MAFRDFLSSISRIKMIPRSGWISHGVALQEVESVADHSFSTSILSMLLADLEAERGSKIDVERVVRLALLHDLPESLTFDISKVYLEYLGKRGEAIKSELDQAAWRHLIKGIDKVAVRSKYAPLQSEFDAERSLESQIVHAADRLDILLQIIEYRRKGYSGALFADLWNSTSKRLRGSGLPSVSYFQNILTQVYKKYGGLSS